MDARSPLISGPVLSRRQFGLIVGGGAFLVVAGATYGAVSGSGPQSATQLDTAFGLLSVTRAGRLARLNAQGVQAFRSIESAAALLDDPGAVAAGANRAVTGSFQRAASPTNPPATSHDHDHDHEGAPPEDPNWPQPLNLTWGDVILLEVELHNSGQEPVLFSPGQLRLKLLPSGTTVTPQDFDRGLGSVEPGAAEHFWISYLAPHDALAMELEFSEPEHDGTATLPLPLLTVSQVKS
ncbi:hypothetical protein ACFVTM_10795 [Arthrobacter sp. NPDC058130]|uniref:hypothetical protein n=1 Tax=Arthrobacter sp. NPDC058130 TaxID=3346353 RepID=UPI0036EB8AC0